MNEEKKVEKNEKKQLPKMMTTEEAKTKLDSLNESVEIEAVAEMINDNNLEFDYEGMKCRVRMPTFGEKKKSNDFRTRRQMHLLQEKDAEGNLINKTEEALIAIYKEQGIDILQMDKKVKQLQEDIKQANILLGESLKEKASVIELESHKEDILKLKGDIHAILIQKTGLLEFSLENQLTTDTYYYLTFLITEKLEEDKWVPVWAEYEDFLNANTLFVNRATFYASCISQLGLLF